MEIGGFSSVEVRERERESRTRERENRAAGGHGKGEQAKLSLASFNLPRDPRALTFFPQSCLQYIHCSRTLTVKNPKNLGGGERDWRIIGEGGEGGIFPGPVL